MQPDYSRFKQRDIITARQKGGKTSSIFATVLWVSCWNESISQQKDKRSMKMRQHIPGILLLFGVISLLVAGCGEPSSNGPVTISFWVRAADQTFVEPVVAAYNKSHTNQVALTIIPNDQFVTKFANASEI